MSLRFFVVNSSVFDDTRQSCFLCWDANTSWGHGQEGCIGFWCRQATLHHSASNWVLFPPFSTIFRHYLMHERTLLGLILDNIMDVSWFFASMFSWFPDVSFFFFSQEICWPRHFDRMAAFKTRFSSSGEIGERSTKYIMSPECVCVCRFVPSDIDRYGKMWKMVFKRLTRFWEISNTIVAWHPLALQIAGQHTCRRYLGLRGCGAAGAVRCNPLISTKA